MVFNKLHYKCNAFLLSKAAELVYPDEYLSTDELLLALLMLVLEHVGEVTETRYW